MPLWKLQPAFDSQEKRSALFLDRDGVIIKDCHYLSDPGKVEIITGVGEALIRAREAGFWLVGVSNQSGIGRGKFTHQDFDAVMHRMWALLEKEGASLDAFFYCPHGPDDKCSCRKPLPGMLEETGEHLAWTPENSWVIGDKQSDVGLGRDHDLGGILVRTGYGLQEEAKVRKEYAGDSWVRICDNLPAAINSILENRGQGASI